MLSDAEARHEPVAVIGLACRFPKAESVEAFWQLLRDGADGTSPRLDERPSLDEFYGADPAARRDVYRRAGGFLGRVDLFDAAFFGISPREATAMDPQQRLLLEVAWEALEDAGQVAAEVGREGGVFVGMWINDYEDLLALAPAELDLYSVTGGSRFSASGRLSFCLDFEGPSLTVDTACSSSLTAVHLACQSLRERECRLALAGGVNLILQPQATLGFGQANLLAADGRCKFGDRRADGFSRSEGVGVAVLKPLSLARDDGDPIRAVIRGSAVNNNGKSAGQMVTPGLHSQAAGLRQACLRAGITPAELDYVEAHGTGTRAGDPIELRALGAALTESGRPRSRPCAVGSVKTNIGHTEGASGIAGLIKVVLALEHRQIPPSLYPEEPSPGIPWDELPLEIVRELRPWPAATVRRAGLNSFGLSGTNAHVVLEEAPASELRGRPEDPGCHLLPLSAASAEALAELAQRHRQRLNDGEAGTDLRDVCYTAAVHRSHLDHRLALVARDGRELAEQLRALAHGETTAGMSAGQRAGDARPKTAFVFSGQGAQWPGMGRRLLGREKVFRHAMERCSELWSRHSGRSLLDEITAGEDTSRLEHTEIAQGAIFAVQVALAELWCSWGVAPAAVAGHSVGEVAAAHVAGALDLEEAVRVVYQRGRVMEEAAGRGAMALVGLAPEEVEERLAPHHGVLTVAAVNGPRSTVVSGDPQALEKMLAELEDAKVSWRRIRVSYAFHSPQMDPCRHELRRLLADLEVRPAKIPIFSTISGAWATAGDFGGDYWGENVRRCVRFADAVDGLALAGCDLFLEVAPHPVLAVSIAECLEHHGREDGVSPPYSPRGNSVLPSLRRNQDERETLLRSLGSLYTAGLEIEWRVLHPEGGRAVDLPRYPWQRRRFWYELPQRANLGRGAARSGAAAHPLLGTCLRSSLDSGTFFWELDLGPATVPYLAEHRIRERPVLPAAAYVEMALAAATEALGPEYRQLADVNFREALVFTEEARVQVVVTAGAPAAGSPGSASFRISSLKRGSGGEARGFVLHASGTLRAPSELPVSSSGPALEEIRARAAAAVPADDLYAALADRSFSYGPSFQGIVELFRGQEEPEALGRLRLKTLADSRVQVPPTLLDACFQVLLGVLDDGDTWLPTALDGLELHEPLGAGEDFWGHARLTRSSGRLEVEGDVILYDTGGKVLLVARGLRLRRLESAPSRGDLADCFYEVRWLSEPLDARSFPPLDSQEGTLPHDASGTWLLLADRGRVAAGLAERLAEGGGHPRTVSPADAYAELGDGRFQVDPERPEDFARLFATVFASGPPCRGVVHLWSLDIPAPGTDGPVSGEEAELLGCVSLVHLVRGLAAAPGEARPQLWLVTAGSQDPEDRAADLVISRAPVWSLAGVVASEHPGLRSTRVDLGSDPRPQEIAALGVEILAGGSTDQVALRGEMRYVARLARLDLAAAEASVAQGTTEVEVRAAEGQAYRLEIATPGILDDLVLRAVVRPAPGPGEVEVEVVAAGLNFHDIMLVMGLLPDMEGPGAAPLLGVECAGRIRAVGEGVEGLRPGDAVVGFARGSFARYVITDARLMAPKPERLSFEEAASIPAVFVTAWYALRHLGRLARGERVLIHSASGGVGLAAVRIARLLGAEIFATAGSPEKRAYLESLGLEHVMDSRSPDFAGRILELTSGRGVDAVLNSQSGPDAIARNLGVLAPYGRFLEIGKRDLYENSAMELRPFLKNLAYFTIDVKGMAQERPELFRTLLDEVLRHFADATFEPSPIRTYGVSEAREAFRYMAQARHIGKIVLALAGREVKLLPARREASALRADATYLITGGLGGLGLAIARFLVDRGARHLVLVARGEATPAARAQLEALEAAGAEVAAVRADVARHEELAAVMARVRLEMPLLCGVVHAAGVLDDATVLELDRERLRTVARPKVDGAWHLHTLTRDDPLDFFVTFSSVAALLDLPGQGNYAAANAFLDALVRRRRARGLAGSSIAWGPWSEIGMAAAHAERGERLARRGLGSLRPEAGLAAFARILAAAPVGAAVMPFDARRWSRTASGPSPFLALLDAAVEAADRAPEGGQREALALALGQEIGEALEIRVRREAGRVLRLAPSEIDPHQPLETLGLDSLMALELRNRLEAELDLSLSSTVTWNHPTTAALAIHLEERIGPSRPANAAAVDAPIEDAPAGDAPVQGGPEKETEDPGWDLLMAEVGQLSDEEAIAALRQG